MSVERLRPGRGRVRASDQGRTADRIRLERAASGLLTLIDHDGRWHGDIEPLRAFPFSDPMRWIVLRDRHARELLCIEDLAALDASSRVVLEEALARREFVPVIERIEHIAAHAEPCRWQVVTDRGVTSFMLNSEDDVRPVHARRVLITDADGMRYLIPDLRALDAASQCLLERYV
jgi:hypothetical protein